MNPPDNAENPFCARRVRPGAIPFVFPPGESAETMLARLRQLGWRAEIVGPHGSGKSTLLVALNAAMRQSGIATVHVELHDGQRRLPLNLKTHPAIICGTNSDDDATSSCEKGRVGTIVIVDGYEQLSYLSRLKLRLFCRRRQFGLLVTSHRPVGLPPLCRTVVAPDLANQIVAGLLRGQGEPFTPEEVSECLARHGGDLREALFDLYDLYQLRRLASGGNAT